MPAADERERELLQAALKVMDNAHVLWGFKVGAAVLAEDGKTYEGCNVESWISGLGTCAERCAIDHAVLHGNRKIKKVAIVIEDKNVETTRPCGLCLQYIKDFSEDDSKVIMAKAKGGRILSESIETKTIEELMPFSYEMKQKALDSYIQS
ncbi:MAG TPA: cytidine deaminase [Candidatus Bathyarchaeia archaeon]|nr:cytidine deaminase [Candidatus Bathyarchaeia archaeon]